MVGEAFEAGAVGMDAVEIGGTGALGSERDPIAFGRPGGIVVERIGRGERAFSGAVGIGDEQIHVRGADPEEGDAVGRRAEQRSQAQGGE